MVQDGFFVLVIADCDTFELLFEYAPDGRSRYVEVNVSSDAWSDALFFASTFTSIIDRGITEVLLLTDIEERKMRVFASNLQDLLMTRDLLLPVQTYMRCEEAWEARVVPCY